MKINQLKTGVLLSYFSNVLIFTIGIFYTPVMIRLLGQSEYGLYNLAAAIISYLGILNFGFGSAYMRFYSRYKVKDERSRIATLNGMFLTIFSILGVLAIVAGIILAFNVDIVFGPSLTTNELKTAQILMLILVINLSVSFPNIVFDTYITANEKFVFQNILQIIRQLTTPLINLPILLMGYGSVGMVIVTTMINVIVEIITMLYCIRKIGMDFSFKNFDFTLMKEMTVFSSYIFVNMIIDQINWNVDKFILGRYQGTISVAIYSVAAQINTYYQQISITISSVFIPRIHRMIATNTDNSNLTHLFTRIGRIQFILLSVVVTGFIFFGQPFIIIWAGDDYYQAYAIALLLMIPVTIPLIQNIGIEIQRAKNMHKFRSWVYLLIAIGNVIISIPLAKSFGGIGAAIGTALSFIIGNGFIMNWYNHFKVGLDMKYFWKQIISFFPAFIIPTLFGMTVNYFFNLNNIFILVIIGLLYVCVFGGSMWIFGMNSYEKNLIRKPISNKIGRNTK